MALSATQNIYPARIMGGTSLLFHSTHQPLSISSFSSANRMRTSFSLNFKHLARTSLRTSLVDTTHSSSRTQVSPASRCSYSNSDNLNTQNSIVKFLNFPVISSLDPSYLTPLNICKWSAIICIAVAAAKKTASTLMNPFFWMYFSWTWLFWPWLVAISLAIYGLYCLRKHSQQKASIFEQIVIVTSAFTWLTLVPPAHFNGFLEGWPIVFFLVYHYFFFFNSSIRKRLYGDLYTRDHDPKWDVRLPNHLRILFAASVLVGHWFAAAEGPALHTVSGGWTNVAIWVAIAVALFSQYHASLYLAKYSEKVVVPTAVVQFGPYRWVRHPVYASTILMFAVYCAALRAPLSLLFVVGACVAYYEQKAKLEEGLMLEAFGQMYKDYMTKVKYKFIPGVF
ncbi:uncharacterized protein [Aristolochia californica]|uniref:uncharacterized protein n=1 Tax=Aristolochia californica TaxID=171875 RepID=UPI0035D98AE7